MIRNLSVRSKLIGILIAPLLALTLLTSLGIGANLAVKVEAERLGQEAAYAKSLSRLVHELQAERDLSAGWVAAGRASRPSWPSSPTPLSTTGCGVPSAPILNTVPAPLAPPAEVVP